MLCELAHSFPNHVAELLHRDRGLTRNFREETVTDLLMSSLVGLESFGIRVDFPDEPTTGGDMDWIYAAPLEVNGGAYFRVILQAKRAQFNALKNGGYWFYKHLDHGAPLGQQAQTLVDYASTSPDGLLTLPVYILYHSLPALTQATATHPAIEGVNLVFAHHIASTVIGGCSRFEKKIDYWRNRFMPLSELLCWPIVVAAGSDPNAQNVTRFTVNGTTVSMPFLAGGFHPDIVARRFRDRYEATRNPDTPEIGDAPAIETSDHIPDHITRAINGQFTHEDRLQLKRPRVILSTNLRRSDPQFDRISALGRRPS